MNPRTVELLSPAKNLQQGIEAVNHGADALYIGAPAFGARAAATNTVQDIEELVRYAHLYKAKVYVTVNTLLYDSELESARRLIRQLYESGVDALIVQDLGLLELDLPPITLHASTQTHNFSPERVSFLEKVGFKRVILARETSLEEMRAIRESTSVELETFVQGALCVSYSGQCYMSQFLNQRSGNRGECGQPCRSSYDLYNQRGDLLKRKEHLLSLKDFNASQHLDSMIDMGICSFKIEGRLKDSSYVKNVTGYYRELIDSLLEERPMISPSSSGKTTLFFSPDPSRTFNRGFTDYFLQSRRPMASHSTQKSLGKQVGSVEKVFKNGFQIKSEFIFTPGDGLCFFNSEGELEGFLVNRVEGSRITPNRMPSIIPGTILWRNNDFAFEKQLQGNSAERKLSVSMIFSPVSEGFSLRIKDEDDLEAVAVIPFEHQEVQNPEKFLSQLKAQLSKLGGTIYRAVAVDYEGDEIYFLPMSAINELRRKAIALLDELRIKEFRPKDMERENNDVHYFEKEVDYKANVVNSKSEQFYHHHGVEVKEHGLEQTLDYKGKALMTTRYCLRYELGECLRNQDISPEYRGALYLRNNQNFFRLEFDCSRCGGMKIYKASPEECAFKGNSQKKKSRNE